jgi:ABC-2 type transport system ATP-binding protein
VWGDLTVEENLEFVAVANRMKPAERAVRIAEILDVTNLSDARDRLAADLSGGMRQKLGVAAAVLPEPDLLVLDEPTTGLDPVSRSDLWRLISRFVRDGMAVLWTTTYLNEAEMAHRAIALETGRTLASGTVDDIVRSMRGAIGVVSAPGHGHHSWRRGAEWRVWYPDGRLPDGVAAVQPDLTDVVTVSAMAQEER